MMEVILKQEIRKLGGKGDVVRVANGYARNFLFPKQMALPATAANKKQIEEMRASADREAARLRGDASKLAEQLQALTIEITARAGDSDQLFGSVTSRDIAAELETKGYVIDRHKILVDKPIRMVGESYRLGSPSSRRQRAADRQSARRRTRGRGHPRSRCRRR